MDLQKVISGLQRLDRQAQRSNPEGEYQHELRFNGGSAGVLMESENEVVFAFSSAKMFVRKFKNRLGHNAIANVGDVIQLTTLPSEAPDFEMGAKLVVVEVGYEYVKAIGADLTGEPRKAIILKNEFTIL